MKDITALAIDLAKASFQLHGVDDKGKKIFGKALSRDKLEVFIAQLPPCVIFMEACGSAHFWAGRMASYGHTPKLIAPQFVRPFVKTNKSDAADAEGIIEAGSRPSMRFVSIKTSAQLDVQAIHRVRSRLVGQRTALTNEMRGIVFEQGLVVAQGSKAIRALAASLVDGEPTGVITPACRVTLADLKAELADLDDRIAVNDRRLEQFAQDNDAVKRLLTIPGVGLLTATAAVAATPDPGAFKNGRQYAAWLGLVPRHSGTGGADKNRNGRISKRGDAYLRCLLVHGARSVLQHIGKRHDCLGTWAAKLKDKRGWNKAVVAMANKNARIMWAVMANAEACFVKNHRPTAQLT
jgi:transposase